MSSRIRTAAFCRALAAARYAPSVYNRQAWKWRLTDDGLDPIAEPRRMAGVDELDERLVTIGCGARWATLVIRTW